MNLMVHTQGQTMGRQPKGLLIIKEIMEILFITTPQFHQLNLIGI